MNFQFDLKTVLNLGAILLGGYAVKQMLTVTLARPGVVAEKELSDQTFVLESDNANFEDYWKVLISDKDARTKLQGYTFEFSKLSGLGTQTWGVRFGPPGHAFPMWFTIDEETKNSLIANAIVYNYSYKLV